MKRVLIAGATGCLSRYLVKVFGEPDYQVRALARDPKKLDDLRDYIDEIFEGEVTNRKPWKVFVKALMLLFPPLESPGKRII